MKIFFDATLEDYLDTTNRYLDGVSRNSWLATAIWLSFMVCILAMLIFRDNLGAIFILTISFAICYSIFHLYFEKRSLQEHCKRAMNGRIFVPIEIEISEESISCKQLFSRISYFWEAVTQMEETDEAIYFYTKDKNVLAVRKRGFESNEQMQEFTALVNNYFDFPKSLKSGK